jgi:drug/metabolite transporter (DMT)-like permease
MVGRVSAEYHYTPITLPRCGSGARRARSCGRRAPARAPPGWYAARAVTAPRRIPLALLLAILAVSTGAPFARWAAPAPAIAIAALRVAMAAVLLLAAGWRELGSLGRIARRDQPLVVLSGVLLAVHFGSWIASLSFTSTAASVALVCTNPIFAALFGRLLGDRVTAREIAGIAIAACGCAVLAGGDWQAGGPALIGDGLALIGAATAAAYLVVGRRLRTALPLLPYLGAVNAIAALCLVIAALVLGAPLAGLPAQAYVACAGAAVLASFVGHSLLNAAVRTTPTHLVALAVLGEPIGSSLITWAAFGERPPLHAAIGGAVVLGGIAIGFVRWQATTA